MAQINEYASSLMREDPALFNQTASIAATFATIFNMAVEAFNAVIEEAASCEQQQLDFEEETPAQQDEPTLQDARYVESRMAVLEACRDRRSVWNRYCARAVDAAEIGTSVNQFTADTQPMIRYWLGAQITNTERSTRTSYLNRAVVALFPETRCVFRISGNAKRLDASPWTKAELEELYSLLD